MRLYSIDTACGYVGSSTGGLKFPRNATFGFCSTIQKISFINNSLEWTYFHAADILLREFLSNLLINDNIHFPYV